MARERRRGTTDCATWAKQEPLTTPPPWEIAVLSAVPLLPLAEELANACCPFAVVAVAWELALPWVTPVPPVAFAVALTNFVPVSAIEAVAAPPAPPFAAISLVPPLPAKALPPESRSPHR